MLISQKSLFAEGSKVTWNEAEVNSILSKSTSNSSLTEVEFEKLMVAYMELSQKPNLSASEKTLLTAMEGDKRIKQYKAIMASVRAQMPTIKKEKRRPLVEKPPVPIVHGPDTVRIQGGNSLVLHECDAAGNCKPVSAGSPLEGIFCSGGNGDGSTTGSGHKGKMPEATTPFVPNDVVQ